MRKASLFTYLKGITWLLIVFLTNKGLLHAEPWTEGTDGFDEKSGLESQVGKRFNWFGPLFHTTEDGKEWGWTLSPLMSFRKRPDLDVAEFDFGYPVFSYSRFGQEYRYQFLQFLSWSGGNNQTNQVTKKVSLFPLVFVSRSADPENHYTAIGPFHGTINHRLMRDKIEFTLFPLYSRTWKKDVVTRNYLYPVVHFREGDDLHGWQIWPLYGEESKKITVVTNRFGDPQQSPGHVRQFVLWPFWSRAEEGKGTTNELQEHLVFPFYHSVRSSVRDITSVLLPFGPTWTSQRDKEYFEFGFPWPLIGFARGKGKEMNRFTPFFSQVSTPTSRSGFYLWPLYIVDSTVLPQLVKKRTRIGLFLYSDLTQSNPATGRTFHRRDLWPLFTKREETNGDERLQILALLEPLIPENRRIKRTYSPAYSVWTSEKSVANQKSNVSALWGLYRHEKEQEVKKVSIFFGLVGYQMGGDREGRRFWFGPPSFGRR